MNKKYITVEGKVKYLSIGKGAIILRSDNKEGMTSTVKEIRFACIDTDNIFQISFETENTIYTVKDVH